MHLPPTSQSVNRVGSNPFGPPSSLVFFVTKVVVGLLCRFEVVVDFCVPSSTKSFFDATADLLLCVKVVVASKASEVFPDDTNDVVATYRIIIIADDDFVVSSAPRHSQKTTPALRPKHQGNMWCRPPKPPPPPPLENAAFKEIIIVRE